MATFINVRKDTSQGGSAIGRMKPIAGMATNLGTIASVKDGWVFIGTTNPKGVRNDRLFITETVATANSWPSGNNSVEYKHNKAFRV